ncbi:hypothetical protein PoB_003987000 [Plakobranchus ocellatus]|uniref:Uncharacterized protein n=1 Tax=Plakobranchus ocellatus TaxID=259542 RepID=A0AAV4B2S2_9GAST|nr:hypothetical protein PoB_003987000 [Plakobranchus ocellatus]
MSLLPHSPLAFPSSSSITKKKTNYHPSSGVASLFGLVQCDITKDYRINRGTQALSSDLHFMRTRSPGRTPPLYVGQRRPKYYTVVNDTQALSSDLHFMRAPRGRRPLYKWVKGGPKTIQYIYYIFASLRPSHYSEMRARSQAGILDPLWANTRMSTSFSGNFTELDWNYIVKTFPH